MNELIVKNHKGTIFLVEESRNPSFEYFLQSELNLKNNSIIHCTYSYLPPLSDLKGSIVVFVRYITPAWMNHVGKVRDKLKDLIFFMDDDLFDFSASAGMPLRYRFKLLRYSVIRREWLRQMGAKLWVSTEYLLNKYSDWSPRLILPKPLADIVETRRFFYHGSASHGAEVKWLRPIVEEVLFRDESFTFEIIGGPDVNRLYRGLPRVTVLHPMKWPSYRAFLAMPGRHVGLVPQLDTLFNRARSYTKFFDITHCGAVGIYTLGSECSNVVVNEVDGRILKLESQVWVEAIVDLLRDEPKRQNLFLNAEQKLLKMSNGN